MPEDGKIIFSLSWKKITCKSKFHTQPNYLPKQQRQNIQKTKTERASH